MPAAWFGLLLAVLAHAAELSAQEVGPAASSTVPSPPPRQAALPHPTTSQPALSRPVELPASSNQAMLPLAPRGRQDANRPTTDGLPPIVTSLGSLAVVLALFFLLAWFMRRAGPKGNLPLPADVVEVLGHAPLPGRQQMQLIRCGHKLLLVALCSDRAETLTEITDPTEVERLAGICQQAHPQSATASFRQVLEKIGREPTTKSFLPEEDRRA